MDLLVATRSAHKMVEIRRILDEVPGLRVLDLNDVGIPPDEAEDALEPYETFEENARSKAAYFHRLSGLLTVADDSGIEIDALDGAPGVRSKRFAPDPESGAAPLEGQERDDANNAYVLERLRDRNQAEERGARYVCVAVLLGADEPVVFRGEAPGRILTAPRGAGGFGYDPLFFDQELGCTFAEISREEKNLRSHRGKAFRAMAQTLREMSGQTPTEQAINPEG